MKLKDKYKYAIAPLVTAVILLIVYALKNIYPFGNNTVDYYDMGQQIASFYYHVYDFLHGEKSIFYDPYTALSVNMAMSTSGCSHFSIFNLFFLFIKREYLIESLSIFLLIKMMCMSFFMYLYIHKRFSISLLEEVLLSVTYAFSGYVLLLYLTIQWLDIAALFPLLMYFLHELLKDGKKTGYIIVLTMSIVASYYLSFMILIYIVLMVGVVVFSDKLFDFLDKRKSVISKAKGTYTTKKYENYHLMSLLVSTIIALLLSMFILLPQLCQTLISARFNNESEGGLLAMYYDIVSTTSPAYTTRWFVLFGMSFTFAVIVAGVVKNRKDTKTVFMTVFALFIVLSEFVVEGVNLFWHFGSYVQYPIRNGFVIIFTIIVIACGYLEKFNTYGVKNSEEESVNEVTICEKNRNILGIKKIVFYVLKAITVCVLALLAISFYASKTGLSTRNVFHITALIMLVTFILYLAIIFVKDGKYKNISAYLVAAELVFYGFIMIGRPTFTTGYTEDPEQENGYIKVCNAIDKEWELNAANHSDEDGNLFFSRVKNPDTTLNANYGLVLRRPCLSNWTHLLSPKLQRDAAKLGYTVQYTRLLDAGGTAFSDALLGINQIISVNEQDERLYTKIKETTVGEGTQSFNGLNLYSQEHLDTREYYLYDSKYTLPYGLVVSDIDYNFESGETCDIYNAIYKSISGDDGKIAKYILNKELSVEPDNISFDKQDDMSTCDMNINVVGNKALYYFADQVDTDDYNTVVRVNGKPIMVPTIGNYNNDIYPAHFNNNALFLGAFSDEDVDVSILYSDYVLKDFTEKQVENSDKLDILQKEAIIRDKKVESEFVPRILEIDLDKLSAMCDSYNDNVSYRSFNKSKYIFNVKADYEGQYLLLPISYDEGYKATINGEAIKAIPVGGIFMALPLNAVNNSVVISFSPKGLLPGIAVSLIGVLVIIAIAMLDNKKMFLSRDYKWLTNLYVIGFAVIILAMYIVPYIFFVVSFIA